MVTLQKNGSAFKNMSRNRPKMLEFGNLDLVKFVKDFKLDVLIKKNIITFE